MTRQAITVRKRADWLTPFEVEVPTEQGTAVARFAAAAKAQEYALRHHDLSGAPLVYDVDVSGVPTYSGSPETSKRRQVTEAEFQARYQRICAKCRVSKPLNQYGAEYHRNRTTKREVFHGYRAKCLECEEAA